MSDETRRPPARTPVLLRCYSALEHALRDGVWRQLVLLGGYCALGGFASAVAGLYPAFFVLTTIPLGLVAFRNSTAACAAVALTSAVVAVGALDVGFHLLPSYVLVIAGVAGAGLRREWRGLSWAPPDILAAAFATVATTVTLATIAAVPMTTVESATGVNSHSLRGPAQLAALLLMLGLYGLMRAGVRDFAQLRVVGRALLVGFLFVGAYAAYQAVARLGDLPYAFVNERRSVEDLGVGLDQYVRVNATLPEASPLAALAFFAIAAGVARLVSRDPQAFPPTVRSGWFVTALGLAVFIAALSKAAILAAILVLPAFLYVLAKTGADAARLRVMVVSAVVLLAALGGTLVSRSPTVVRDPAETLRSEAYVRVGYWRAALDITQAHPLGVGVGNYTFYYPRYAPMGGDYEYYPRVADAHNWYLEALAETGVLGGGLFLAFVLSLAAQGVGRSTLPRPDRRLLVALSATWTVFAVMHVTYSYFYYPFEWVVAGLLGAGGALRFSHQHDSAT